LHQILQICKGSLSQTWLGTKPRCVHWYSLVRWCDMLLMTVMTTWKISSKI